MSTGRSFSALRKPAVAPPGFEPLEQSWAVDDVEQDFKDAVVKVYNDMLAPKSVRIGSYGAPHRAEFTTLEQFVKWNGLAIDRIAGREPFMREIFRAWVARNPRRGLAFLKLYVRMLYPGTGLVDQLWQNPAYPYTRGMSAVKLNGWFLTSRVRVQLAPEGMSVSQLGRALRVMQSLVPAKFVLQAVAAIGGLEGGSVTLHVAAVAKVYHRMEFTGTMA